MPCLGSSSECILVLNIVIYFAFVKLFGVISLC